MKEKIKRKFSKIIEYYFNLDKIIAHQCMRYIFAYHRILPRKVAEEEFVQDVMWTDPLTFEKQIIWMQKIGTILDVRDILNFNISRNKPLFAITFDDGWRDNYEYALPILKKYHIPATVFLVTSVSKNGQLLWTEEYLKKTGIAIRERGDNEVKRCLSKLNGEKIIFSKSTYRLAEYYLEQLKELNISERSNRISEYYKCIGQESRLTGSMLTWKEVGEMRNEQITFGSHTDTHMILKYCDDEMILKELILSKKVIERQLECEVDMFCYPNARFNKDNAFLLKKSGYQYGFILHNQAVVKDTHPYFIPRILVSERLANLSFFKLRLLGIL